MLIRKRAEDRLMGLRSGFGENREHGIEGSPLDWHFLEESLERKAKLQELGHHGAMTSLRFRSSEGELAGALGPLLIHGEKALLDGLGQGAQILLDGIRDGARGLGSA